MATTEKNPHVAKIAESIHQMLKTFSSDGDSEKDLEKKLETKQILELFDRLVRLLSDRSSISHNLRRLEDDVSICFDDVFGSSVRESKSIPGSINILQIFKELDGLKLVNEQLQALVLEKQKRIDYLSASSFPHMQFSKETHTISGVTPNPAILRDESQLLSAVTTSDASSSKNAPYHLVPTPEVPIMIEKEIAFTTAFGVPPPPPLPFLIRSKTAESKFFKSKIPMQPLAWSKMTESQTIRTLWSEILEQVTDIDIQGEEDLLFFFSKSANVPKSVTVASNLSPTSHLNTPVRINLIDSRRSQNIEIMLKGMKISNEELKDAVMRIDDDILNQERLLQIEKLAPSICIAILIQLNVNFYPIMTEI